MKFRILLAALMTWLCATVVRATPTADGQLDPTFGTNGVALIGGVASIDFLPGTLFAATADGSGRIVIAGVGLQANANVLFVTRLLANGAPDTSFGTLGVTTLPWPDQGNFFFPIEHGMNVVVESSGRVVVAAWLNNTTDTMGQYLFALDGGGALIANYGPNGGPGFIDFGSFSPYQNLTSIRYSCSLAKGPDGALYVASWVDYAEPAPVALGRLASDGKLDTTFGTNGRANIVGFCDGMVIQPDGKFLFKATVGATLDETDSAITRYLSNGNLDTQFGSNGVASVPFEPIADFPIAIALDGASIYLGGNATGPDRTGCVFCIARFTSSGVLMTGMVYTPTFDFGGASVLRSGAPNARVGGAVGVGVLDYDIDGDDVTLRAGAFLDESKRLVMVGNTHLGPTAIRVLNDTIFFDGVE